MLTDPSEILEEIIEQDGECERWASPAVCKRCPLGNKRVDGRRMSCADFLKHRYNVDFDKNDSVVNAAYKMAAEEELFAIELEKALE